MAAHRGWAITALVVGIPTTLIGLFFALGYFWWAIIERIGEPDQSLILWYLPILFIGIGLTAVGVVGTLWGSIRLRSPR